MCAHLRGHIHHAVGGGPVASRTQPVPVQPSAGLGAIAEDKQCGAIPALLKALIVLIEVHHLYQYKETDENQSVAKRADMHQDGKLVRSIVVSDGALGVLLQKVMITTISSHVNVVCNLERSQTAQASSLGTCPSYLSSQRTRGVQGQLLMDMAECSYCRQTQLV